MCRPPSGLSKRSTTDKSRTSEKGQNRKFSPRAHVVRFTPESRHSSAQFVCLLSARKMTWHHSQDFISRVEDLGSL